MVTVIPPLLEAAIETYHEVPERKVVAGRVDAARLDIEFQRVREVIVQEREDRRRRIVLGKAVPTHLRERDRSDDSVLEPPGQVDIVEGEREALHVLRR